MSIKALCFGGIYLVRRRPLPVQLAKQTWKQPTRSIYITSIHLQKMGENENAASIFDFTVKDTYGNDVSLDKYRGNVTLVVNTASQCGLTNTNYDNLTKLKQEYESQGLKILAFPCNQFASESPEKDGEEMVCHLRKANADIGEVFKKVDVNGENTAPIYKYLKKEQGGYFGNSVKWNFTKFLVNKDGQPIERFAPTAPFSGLKKRIEEELKK